MAQKRTWVITFTKGYDKNRKVHFSKLSLVYEMFSQAQIGISLSTLQKESKGKDSFYPSTDTCEIRMATLYTTKADVQAMPVLLHPATRTQGGDIARGRHRSQRDVALRNVKPAADGGSTE